MDLCLQDFQAWSHAEIKVEGLTVVVGSSNLGKSAFIRALRGVLRNEISERRIRKGTKLTEVTATFDGTTVTATRTGGSKGEVTYKVGDESYSKLGGKVPPPLVDLNFGKVTVGSYTLDPIFAGQFDGQFLLAADPAEVTAALNAFASTEKLDAGRKALTGNTKEIDTESKVLGGLISQAETTFLEVNTVVTDAEGSMVQLTQVGTEVQRLSRASQALKTLRGLRAASATLTAQVHTVTMLADTLNTIMVDYKAAVRAVRYSAARAILLVLNGQVTAITTVRNSSSLVELARRTLTAAVTLGSTREGLRKAHQQLEGIDTLVPYLEAPTVSSRALQAASTAKRAMVSKEMIHRSLEAGDTLKDTLNPLLVAWKARVRVAALQALDVQGPRLLAAKLGNLKEGLTTPGQFTKVLGIIQVLKTLRESAPTLDAVNQEIQDARAAHDALAQEIARLAQASVTCPKCNHQFIPPTPVPA